MELGQTSRLEWEARALKTKTLAATLWAGTFLANVDIVAVSSVVRIFNMYGASLAIATEFEIELIPKPEPGFFQVTYGISDLRDKAGGRGKQLMQAMCDAVEKYRDYFRKLEHEGESGPSQCDACTHMHAQAEHQQTTSAVQPRHEGR